MFHSFEPVGSHHPVMMDGCCRLYTPTSYLVKMFLQSASYILTIPIKVCLKEGMECPVQGKSYGRLGISKVPVPTERCTWKVALPTCTLCAAALTFGIGAYFAK